MRFKKGDKVRIKKATRVSGVEEKKYYKEFIGTICEINGVDDGHADKTDGCYFLPISPMYSGDKDERESLWYEEELEPINSCLKDLIK